MPRARSNRRVSIGRVSMGRVLRHLQIDTGPRRSPLACSKTLENKTRSAGSPAAALGVARACGVLTDEDANASQHAVMDGGTFERECLDGAGDVHAHAAEHILPQLKVPFAPSRRRAK